MFVFYGLCIIGLIAGAFIWLGQRNAAISANATSTAETIATDAVRTTATILAHETEQAQYKITDTFTDNRENWKTGQENSEYMKGSIEVSDGMYVWDIREAKQAFVDWANFRDGNWFGNYDAYIDSKIIEDTPGDTCSGFVFRTSSYDWENGAYTFSVCNNSYFDIYYYKDGEWDVLVDDTYSSIIKENNWNRLGISIKGSNFAFMINNVIVSEITDERQKYGGIALLVEINETTPTTVLFDNFGLQTR